MGTTTRAVPAIYDRVGFWLTTHEVCMDFYRLGAPELAERTGWAEQNAHDALVVLHALCHRHLSDLGRSIDGSCPAGDGDVLLIEHHFITEEGFHQ